MLKAGADPSLEDKDGRTPAIVAWQNGRVKSMRLMEGAKNPKSLEEGELFPREAELPVWALAKGVSTKSIDILQNMAQSKNAKPSQLAPDPDTGNTGLHYTLINLIASRSQLEFSDNRDSYKEFKGEALSKDARKTLLLLLSLGLSPDTPNDLQRTVLHLAAEIRDPRILRTLLSHTPTPRLDIRDIKGRTPLDVILKSVSENNVGYERHYLYYGAAVQLLAAGAVLSKSTLDHVQRLFITAVELGDVGVAKRMIAQGADVLRADERGVRARMIARVNGDEEMLRVLAAHRSFFVGLRSET